MATLAQLKAAAKKLGIEIEIDENRPNECNNSGHFSVYLDQEQLKQYRCNGCTVVCASYWSDAPGSRGEAIAGLIEDLEYGFEPMSAVTKYECGIE